jgi:hypothetical protein
MTPVDVEAAETLATELLRERLLLVQDDVRQKKRWLARFARLAGQQVHVERMESTEIEALASITEAAYLVGLAVGQRLRPNALNVNSGKG